MTRSRDVATQGGLVLISSTTIGSAVSSVIVTNAFSAAHDNYLIMISNTTGSVANDNYPVQLRTGTTTATTGYYHATGYWNFSATPGAFSQNPGSSWNSVGRGMAIGDKVSFGFNLYQPFLANKTTFATLGLNGSDLVGNSGGYHNSATSYDQFVLSTTSGTMTGGTIKVYGYK